MRAKVSLIMVMVGLTLVAPAQSLDQFLKSRSTLGVSGLTKLETLNSVLGVKTIEVSATLKGIVGIDGKTTLTLALPNGNLLQLTHPERPDWMEPGVQYRVLARVQRDHEYAPLVGELVAGALESDVKARDSKIVKTAPAKPRPSNTSSRSGTNRPAPMQGEIRNTEKWTMSGEEALPYYSAFIRKQNKRLTEAQADKIARGIIGFSIQFDVDARLIVALVIAESNFNPNSRSKPGAMGLGQLMPGTARSLGVSNAYDETQNLYGTVKYLSTQIDRFKTKDGQDFDGLVLALAAYNAGPGAVKKHNGVPPYRETQNYVRKVMSIYRSLCGE